MERREMLTRLNHAKRGRLIAHAEKFVAGLVSDAGITKASARLAPKVRAIVEKKYPPADMAVCKKYGLTISQTLIKMTGTNGLVTTFRFPTDAAPLVAHSHHRMYAAPSSLAQQVAALNQRGAKRKEQINARLADYKALINDARNYEDVLTVWPQAEALRAEMRISLPARVSKEMIQRIAIDSKLAKKAA